MFDKDVAKGFVGKYVGILHKDADKETFSKGTLILVAENSLVIELEFNGVKEAYSFDAILKIRELVKHD